MSPLVFVLSVMHEGMICGETMLSLPRWASLFPTKGSDQAKQKEIEDGLNRLRYVDTAAFQIGLALFMRRYRRVGPDGEFMADQEADLEAKVYIRYFCNVPTSGRGALAKELGSIYPQSGHVVPSWPWMGSASNIKLEGRWFGFLGGGGFYVGMEQRYFSIMFHRYGRRFVPSAPGLKDKKLK